MHRLNFLFIAVILFLFLPDTRAEISGRKNIQDSALAALPSANLSKIEKEESLAVASLLESIESDDSEIQSPEKTDKNGFLRKGSFSGKSILAKQKELLKKHTYSLFEHSFFRKYLKHILCLLLAFFTISLVVFLWRNKKDSSHFMTTGRLSIMDKEVQRACNYIEDNFDKQELSVQMICNELVTGEAFLNALFMKELGISIEEFITQVRVNRLKIMLDRDPDLSMDELLLRSGFQNEKQMQDSFFGITGTKMENYRKSMQPQMPV